MAACIVKLTMTQITLTEKLCNRIHNEMEAANYSTPAFYEVAVEPKTGIVSLTLNIQIDPQKVKKVLESINESMGVLPGIVSVKGKVVFLYQLEQ